MRIETASISGTTLWELLCAIAILAMLMGFGAPAFQSLTLDARRDASLRAFFDAVQLARSAAIAGNAEVILCPSSDGQACLHAGPVFDEGWIVFANTDAQRPPVRAEDEPVLAAGQPAMDGTIRTNRALFEFRPPGRRSTNGTVTFCDRRGEDAARAVIVSYTGRPRTSHTAPGGRALVCAEAP